MAHTPTAGPSAAAPAALDTTAVTTPPGGSGANGVASPASVVPVASSATVQPAMATAPTNPASTVAPGSGGTARPVLGSATRSPAGTQNPYPPTGNPIAAAPTAPINPGSVTSASPAASAGATSPQGPAVPAVSKAPTYETFSVPESQRKAAIALMAKINKGEASAPATTDWFTKLSNILMHLW